MTTHARDLTPQEIATFRTEGVVQVRNLLDWDYFEVVRKACYAQRDRPTKWGGDINPPGSSGQFFMDRHMWAYQDHWREIAFRSGQGRVAAQAMGSDEVRLYFDHLWFHAPNTPEPFDWHQDGNYWPFRGDKICSIWIAMEDDSAIEYVRHSHRWNIWYRPVLVGASDELSEWVGKSYETPMPDFHKEPEKYEFLTFDIKAGDALIFNTRIVHTLPGNPQAERYKIGLSTRYLGDDAVWDPRPGTDPIVTQADVKVQPGERAIDPAFPLLYAGGRDLPG